VKPIVLTTTPNTKPTMNLAILLLIAECDRSHLGLMCV
jgi:hypothetical protein